MKDNEISKKDLQKQRKERKLQKKLEKERQRTQYFLKRILVYFLIVAFVSIFVIGFLNQRYGHIDESDIHVYTGKCLEVKIISRNGYRHSSAWMEIYFSDIMFGGNIYGFPYAAFKENSAKYDVTIQYIKYGTDNVAVGISDSGGHRYVSVEETNEGRRSSLIGSYIAYVVLIIFILCWRCLVWHSEYEKMKSKRKK
jgi:hypothetical protein